MLRRWRAVGAALLVSLVAAPTWAGGWPAPADVTAWVGSESSERFQVSETGDLSGRGTTDWAGVVRRASADVGADQLGGWQVVVFLQQPDGHYRLAVQSPPFSFNCGTSRCWMENLRIARRSVFVEWKLHWHNQFSTATLQFQARDGGWPVIGRRDEVSDDPDDGSPSWQQTVDVDRLTGQAIVTCKMDHRAKRTTRSKLPYPRTDLADFSDWFYEDSYEKLPGRCPGH